MNRTSISVSRQRPTLSSNGLCSHAPGPDTGCSRISTREPAPSGRTRRSTVASPIGQPRACSTSRRWSSQVVTSVSSCSIAGHAPTAWYSLLPSRGQAGSTALILIVPTTHAE